MSPQFFKLLSDGRFGEIQADRFVGAVSGPFTGNLTGNVTGNVTGNLTGNVTGNVAGSVTGAVNLPATTVAALGSDQAGAAAVAAGFTLVTAANDAKGVRLPAATAGAIVILRNTVADKYLKVYPATGDKINDGSADAAVEMEEATNAVFIAYDTTDWYTLVFTAN